MSNQAKVIRGQLRQIVQDILPDLLNNEVKNALYQDLSKQLNARVELIAKNIQETLSKIDERSKDVQGYVVRQSAVPQPAVTVTPAEEVNKN